MVTYPTRHFVLELEQYGGLATQNYYAPIVNQQMELLSCLASSQVSPNGSVSNSLTSRVHALRCKTGNGYHLPIFH